MPISLLAEKQTEVKKVGTFYRTFLIFAKLPLCWLPQLSLSMTEKLCELVTYQITYKGIT